MTLADYLAHRRRFEMLIAVGLVAVSFLGSVGVELVEFARAGRPWHPAVPWLLEGTSHLALLLVIPLVLWFERHFPLTLASWPRSLFAHALFSVLFSLAHVALMYSGRRILFPVLLGIDYRWPHWWAEFGYEYLKDFRGYLLILAVMYLYRFVLVRLQGEAGLVSESEAPEDETPADRFLVKKLGREFLVRIADIEWIESAGNYVNLHVEGRVYPLRGTMTRTAAQLAPRGFVRVHRRAIVNVERVREIEVLESGDGVLRLDTGARVPVSRRYRQALDTHVRMPAGAGGRRT